MPRRRHPRTRAARRPTPSRVAVIQSIESRTLMSAGVLDPSWNTFGTLSIAPPPGSTAKTTVTAVQADERVLVAGVYQTSPTTAVTEIFRRTAQGAVDTTFANGGTVGVNFTVSSMFLQPDGRIIVAGPTLERLNNDGSVDTSFGSGGAVGTPFTLGGTAYQPDGKILVTGNTTSGNVAEVMRYNANGTVDTTFGTNGVVPLAITGGGAATYQASSVTVDPSGRIVVGFSVNGNTALATFGTVRLTTAGARDTSYGLNGVSEVRGYPQPSLSSSLVVAPNGVIYQAGNYNYGDVGGTGYLLAYASNGRSANISPTPGLDTFASDVTVGADNKPIIIGTAVQGSGSATHTVIAVDRFLAVDPTNPASFKPDATFNGTGLVTVAYNGPSSLDSASVGDLGFSGEEMPNGNVVVGGTSVNPGSSTSTFNVTRIIGDLSVAQSVGTVSGVTYFDENFNGKRDANDPGLPGFTAFVDANNDGLLEANEQQVYADANGRYTFNGLAPGTYHIVQSLANGYTHTTNGSTQKISFTVTVAANQTVTGKDLGVTGTDSISGTFFTDKNGNGKKDGGEVGVNGGTVFLDLNGDGQLTSADVSYKTGSSGTFTFTHLTPTAFRVRAVIGTGHNLTTPTTLPLMVTLVGNQRVTGLVIGET